MLDSASDTAVDELIPAIIQCFGVIILGYLAGRWKILSDTQAQGLNSYVTTFALPALFFRVMVTIDFSGVCWYFVAAVSLGKLVAFVLAFSFSLLLSRQCQLGVAAILSMFSSQSNDVALGYPVLKSLYPDLASYVYLFAPTQLVILNPIAYTFLEWHRIKSESHSPCSIDGAPSELRPSPVNRCKRFLQAVWRVIINPIFLMTVIGVVFNFILHHHIPIYVDGLLKILADSFAATALFTLGFGMVGKMGRITQHEIHILVAILMLKLVILPFVTREFVVHLIPEDKVNDSLRYSTFGFLYGAIPTAPPVYLFAAAYHVMPAVIGVGLVVSTFLCAPIMFILSRMVTMYMAEPSDYDHLLGSTVVDVSWMSIAGCLWTAIVLFVNRKAFRIPHRFTMSYLCCVLLSCVGVVAGHFLNRSSGLHNSFDWRVHVMNSPASWAHYVQFAVFFIGCTGTRIWTTLIALSLLLQRKRGTCFVLRHQSWIYLVGFATPVLVTSIALLTFSRLSVRDIDPVFQFGRGQLIASILVLAINSVGTMVFLICYIRCNPDPSRQLADETFLGSADIGASQDLLITPETSLSNSDANRCEEMDQPDLNTGYDNDDTSGPRSRLCRCRDWGSRRQCIRALARYEQLCTSQFGTQPSSSSVSHSNHDDTSADGSEHQRHQVLLFFLLTTMFFGLCLCTWRLVEEALSGVYVVLEFLDGTFNFGQGLALFVIFGLDAELILLPVKRVVVHYMRKLLGSMFEPPCVDSVIIVPQSEEVAEDTSRRSRQFVQYHLSTCENCIATEISCEVRTVKVFSSTSLCQWLRQSGLVHSDLEGFNYLAELRAEHVIEELSTDEITPTLLPLTVDYSPILFFRDRFTTTSELSS